MSAPKQEEGLQGMKEEDLDQSSTVLLEKRRGTRQILPNTYNPAFPPSSKFAMPHDYLPQTENEDDRIEHIWQIFKFAHFDDENKILIITSADWFNDGTGLKAAWTIFVDPRLRAYCYAERLENKGPFGDSHGQDPARAILRAWVAALRARDVSNP
ncbi:hypothetical protein F5Y16DRAFT_384605 [Xylariaceae sp. FL0255]|nr:hypothetical protein F5Y16DRAFT_384605 [Xylariaceae sp. FL0255]